MKPSQKEEARLVARLVEPRNGIVVGLLYLWETGDAEPMWFNGEMQDAVSEPILDEDFVWSQWKLGSPNKSIY